MFRWRKSAFLTSPLHLPRPHTPSFSFPSGLRHHHATSHGNSYLLGFGPMGGGRLDPLDTRFPAPSLSSLSSGGGPNSPPPLVAVATTNESL